MPDGGATRKDIERIAAELSRTYEPKADSATKPTHDRPVKRGPTSFDPPWCGSAVLIRWRRWPKPAPAIRY
jgi:hypothetical protein